MVKSSTKKSNSKKLTNKIPRLKFRLHFKPIETAIILGVILLGTSGLLYQKHEQKSNQQLNITPTSNQSSLDPVSSNVVNQPSQTASTTPNTSTQPAQSTTTAPSSDSSGTGCTQTQLQYSTTQQDDPSFISQYGEYGLNYACPGKAPRILQPTAEIEEIGTGTSSSTSTTEPSQTDTSQGNEQEYQQCMQNINSQLEVDGASGNADAEQEAEEACNQYL
jgi:cytoskeletal protein RodZ